MIIEIGDKLIASDVFERRFVCDLNACKGACCVVGDAGAPLEMEEVSMLESVYPKVKSYLTPQGIQAIEAQGVFYMDQDNDAVTTLMEGDACAFTIFNENGAAMCGIEKAYEAGIIKWKKPISCELFPIRVKKYEKFLALNFDEQKICQPACDCGSKLDVPVYKFLKKAITRAFGDEFYEDLEHAAEALNKESH